MILRAKIYSILSIWPEVNATLMKMEHKKQATLTKAFLFFLLLFIDLQLRKKGIFLDNSVFMFPSEIPS